MSYLEEKNATPVIVGSLAIFQYINVTVHDVHMREYRPMALVDLLVSHVPHPPVDWQESSANTVPALWISPSGGRVVLSTLKQLLKGDEPKSFSLAYDPLSVKAGCPALDITTLFLLKLSSTAPHDFADLLKIALHTKIPKNLEKQLWNSTQHQNLMAMHKWLQLHDPRA
jgi:hypothetical protein